MTSPVGHALGGLIAASLKPDQPQTKPDWRLWLFVIFSANAPDLDFIPGIVIGSVGEYHHLASHSLVAVLIFAGLVYLVVQAIGLVDSPRWVLLGAVAYFSHLLLDLFTTDTALPYGMQLFWPFTDAFYIAPVSLFTDIQHGGVGDSLVGTLPKVFSLHNLMAVGLELALLLPIWWLSVKVRNKRH